MAYENDAYEGFDAVIGEEADEGGFVILPDGEYPFTVTKMDKERFSGSENISPCWLAIVTLQVDGGELGRANVFHRLYMVKKQAWKVKQLFVGVGLVDKDAKSFAPPWNQLIGASGVVKLGHHEHNGKTYNDVDRILDPAAAAEAAARQVSAQPAAPTPPWGK